MRMGVHARSVSGTGGIPLTLHSLFRIRVEGEREAMTSAGQTVYALPLRNPNTRQRRRRIAPQWSVQRVDARLVNCRAWLLHQPDRTALHLISAEVGFDFGGIQVNGTPM